MSAKSCKLSFILPDGRKRQVLIACEPEPRLEEIMRKARAISGLEHDFKLYLDENTLLDSDTKVRMFWHSHISRGQEMSIVKFKTPTVPVFFKIDGKPFSNVLVFRVPVKVSKRVGLEEFFELRSITPYLRKLALSETNLENIKYRILSSNKPTKDGLLSVQLTRLEANGTSTDGAYTHPGDTKPTKTIYVYSTSENERPRALSVKYPPLYKGDIMEKLHTAFPLHDDNNGYVLHDFVHLEPLFASKDTDFDDANEFWVEQVKVPVPPTGGRRNRRSKTRSKLRKSRRRHGRSNASRRRRTHKSSAAKRRG